jgi:hypothetical protein
MKKNERHFNAAFGFAQAANRTNPVVERSRNHRIKNN